MEEIDMPDSPDPPLRENQRYILDIAFRVLTTVLLALIAFIASAIQTNQEAMNRDISTLRGDLKEVVRDMRNELKEISNKAERIEVNAKAIKFNEKVIDSVADTMRSLHKAQ